MCGLSEYVSKIGPVASEVQVGAMHPPQIWMHPLGICKMPNTNMLISPLKNVPHPTAAMLPLLKLRRWEQLIFKNEYTVYARCFVQVTESFV